MRAGLLPHDVGPSAPVKGDVHREVLGAQDVAADITGLICLIEGDGQPLLGVGHLASHIEEALGKPEGVAGDQTSLDELVGVALHEEAVFVGTGLRLVAVHHQIAGPHPRRAEPPLDPGGEPGTAPAQQAGGANLSVDFGWSHLQRPPQPGIPPGALVSGQCVAVDHIEAGSDDLLGHEPKPPSIRMIRKHLALAITSQNHRYRRGCGPSRRARPDRRGATPQPNGPR